MNLNKSKKYFWSLMLFLAAIALTFYFLFNGYNVKELLIIIREANPIYLLAALLLMFLSVSSEALCIKFLMNSLKYKFSFLKCLKFSFIGIYFGSITPSASGGQPLQIYYMKKDGADVGAASLCVMVVTIAYQAGILLICLFALLLKSNMIIQNLGVVKYFSLIGACFVLVFIAAIISVTYQSNFLERLISGIIRFLAKLKLIKDPAEKMQKIEVHLAEYKKSAVYVKNNPRLLLFALLTIVMKILLRLSVAYFVYKAFALTGHGYIEIISLQAFLALGVEYMPLPGAVGAAEAGFMAVNRIIFGSDRLVPALLMFRGINFYALLIVSACVALWAHITVKFRQT